jgi:hypothetical protein
MLDSGWRRIGGAGLVDRAVTLDSTSALGAAQLSAEARLLLACAHTTIDPGRSAAICALLQAPIRWNHLIALAEQHKVLPLLSRQLHAAAADLVLQPVLDLLREQALGAARQSLFLTGALLRLLDLLQSHGIPAIPLKGPLLATIAYGNLALRQFDDLDILVHTQAMLPVRDLLIAQGFQPLVQLSDRQAASYLRSQYVYPFISGDGSTIVELHHDIRPRYFAFHLDPAQLWTRAERQSLGGRQVLNLATEDLLLMLCVHGANHCWERLAWICDLAELLRSQPTLDWPRLLHLARESGGERMLLLGLLLARDLLGAALPTLVTQRIAADAALRSLAATATGWLFRDPAQPLTATERARFHLQSRERLRDRWQYCVYLLTSPTEEDWTVQPLPAALSFLYALCRPLKLLGRYGMQPLKDLIGRQDY